MNKSIERQITNIYNIVFHKIYSKTRLYQLSKGNQIQILQAAEILESSEAYNEFAKKFAKELATKGVGYRRGIWRKFYEAAKKLHYVSIPKTWKEFEMQQLSKAVKHNFDMIKSIPRHTLELLTHKYTSTLIEEVAKGKLNRGSFQKQLEKHGYKNAKLIARTETAKLQTSITENRSKDLGSVAYIWISSNDKRTRQSHKEMNNVVVFWREGMEKPLRDTMYGNAGEFPNCRCAPNPIFGEEDLDKNSYKVYNYKTHKIITMSKKDLVASLEKGSL